MARIANAKDVIANGAGSYIINEIQAALNAFHEELDEDSKLDAGYIAARDGTAKTRIDNAIRMLRWIYETELSLTPPTPYTDGDVDGINIDIRTFDDGL